MSRKKPQLPLRCPHKNDAFLMEGIFLGSNLQESLEAMWTMVWCDILLTTRFEMRVGVFGRNAIHGCYN
jgi:hypothetical protein